MLALLYTTIIIHNLKEILVELEHLNKFLAVAEHLSFTRASKALYLSQPALSRQIMGLETELGVALFNRNAAGLELTAPGRLLVKEARSLLQRSNLVVKMMRAFRAEGKEKLSLGYDIAAVSQTFFGTLARFGAQQPDAELSIHEHSVTALLAQLLAGGCDIAVLGIPRGMIPSECQGIIIGQEPLSLIVGRNHPLARHTSVHLDEVRDDALVVYEQVIAPIWNTQSLDACRQAGFEPPTLVKVNSYSSMLGTIAAGKGYGLLANAIDKNIYKDLVSIPIDFPCVSVDTCAVWHRTSTSLSLRLFLTLLAAEHGLPGNSRIELPIYLAELASIPKDELGGNTGIIESARTVPR